MRKKLHAYIAAFNACDNELYPQLIPNRDAELFLAENIPLIDCPDKELERVYYFRWWTFRKHIKQTDKGCIITEFLPSVPWAGPENSICCPACFHIREGRWLKDSENRLKQYINFWLDGHGDLFAYSTWIAHAVWEYCCLKNDFSYGIEVLPLLVSFFEKREALHRRSNGLYWSNDNRDGMEYSISGPGLRPTLNSYAWADAVAIHRLAKMAGSDALAAKYASKAEEIKRLTDKLLWSNGFYRTIPLEEKEAADFCARPETDDAHHVRELVGFVPWYFNLPNNGRDTVFSALQSPDGFLAPYGLTTAEQCHPRFMEAHDHECLWNGPVWPFATSQVLVAAANLLHNYRQNTLCRQDYYNMLMQYARSHSLTREDGTVVPWIDENLHPFTGQWLARSILEDWGWKPELGGYERGKDYNHSLFCDLVLSGLFGIGVEDGQFTAHPLIPDSWDYFRVENLWLNGTQYRIIYDKDGTHYGLNAGLSIQAVT